MLAKAFLILIVSLAGVFSQETGPAPVITADFQVQRRVFAGDVVRFEVTATSDEPIGYRWYCPGPILAGGDSWIETRFDGPATTNPEYVSVRVFNRHAWTNRDCLISRYSKNLL